MTSARGSVNLNVLKNKARYERPNSLIFAPFMINVVCNLLNTSKLTQTQKLLHIPKYINQWGGGLHNLKQCYSDWDKRVSEACQTTPIGHAIWRKFINQHNIPNRHTFEPIDVLTNLLQHWWNTGKQNNTFGPYPSPYEQNEYQSVCIIPVGHLNHAILNDVFEPCFKANNLDLITFIQQSQKQSQNHAMDEDSKAEYSGFPDEPFKYDNQSNLNFVGNSNQNFEGYKDEKEPMMDRSKSGMIYYQSAYYTREQCLNISHHFMYGKENAPKLLFGDNNIDKQRHMSQNRIYFGGQAQDLGQFDRWFGYGITTTWKEPMNGQSSYFQGLGQHNVSPRKLTPDLDTFKQLMDHEFKALVQHIAKGRDIIVPAPNAQDLHDYRNKYFDHSNRRKFLHNLGTGTADLEDKYLKYIQLKLNQLQQYASNTQRIDYVKLYGNQSKNNIKQINVQTRNRPYEPITLTPREQLRRTQYRRDANGLSLPFDNNNNNIFSSGNVPKQRLNFDEKEPMHGSLVHRNENNNNSEYKQDPYGSIHYESPQHRPQQRRRNSVRNQMFQQRDNAQNNRANITHAPQRMDSDGFMQDSRRYPHYKSPNRDVSKSEWNVLSSPQRRERTVQRIVSGSVSPARGERSVVNYGRENGDVLRNTMHWCFWLLFFFPKRIYVASVIQNRPQDVFKLLSIVFFMLGCVLFGLNWDFSDGCVVCVGCAMVCALCGGDQFYPERIKRFRWNG